MPNVSVVMAVRNGERFLQQAIASIRNQTYRELEFIIVNDGSTDSSRHIMEAEANADSRIRILDLDSPGGVSAAANHGISHAISPIIARMDGDDLAMPERLAVQMVFLDQNPHIAVCGTGMYHMDEDNPLLDMDWIHPSEPDAIYHHLRTLGNCIMHPTTCFRREAFDNVGGYRAQLEPAEDFDLWLRISRNYNIANLDEKYLYYRHHNAQSSETARVLQQAKVVEALYEDKIILDAQN